MGFRASAEYKATLAAPADPSGGRSAADDASRGSAIKLGAELAARLIALATTLMVARVLGVADFGLFAVLSGVAVIVAELSDLGIQGIAVQALVSGTIPLRSLIRTKARLTAALVIVASLAALAPASWRPAGGVPAGRMPLLFPLIVYFALAGWAELLGMALRVRGRRALEAATIVTLRVSGLVLAAAALWSGRGLRGLVWAMAVSAVPPIALAAAFLSRTSPPASDRGAEPIGPGVVPTLKASFPLAINGALALLSLRIELLGLAALRGSREAGLFAAALKVVELVNVVPAAIAAGAMPALTREAVSGTGPVRRRTAATVALLAAPAAAGVILVAPAIVKILGAGYSPAAGPLRILAPALLPLFMNTVLLHALVAAGRARRLPALTAWRVAAAILLAVVLIPRLGAAGAAAGFLAAELILLVLAARACGAAGFEVPVVRSLCAAMAVTLPMAAAVALAGPGLVRSIAVGLVAYAVTLLLARRLAPRFIPGLAGPDGAATTDDRMGSNPITLVFRHAFDRRREALFAARSRVVELGGLDLGTARDLEGAFAGPGALDGADLAAMGESLAAALVPGAPVLLCVGGGQRLPIPEARARLGPAFVWRRAFALGVIVPGESAEGWARDHPQTFGVLAALEGLVRGWPVLRARGDYVVIEGARR